MTDIVERLRDMAVAGPHIPSCQLCREAADEIERLRNRIAQAMLNDAADSRQEQKK